MGLPTGKKNPPNHIHAWRVRGLLRAYENCNANLMIDTMKNQ